MIELLSFKPLAFIVTLGILILIHEYGHYRVAVACGVKVDRFSLGFGRVLWRRQPTPGGTEFVISALPLGGYVRWIDDRESGVLPEEANQTFKSKSLAQRTAIVAAGPLSNLLLAVLLYAAANWIGIDEPKALLGTPSAASLAERAGVHAGDLVQATSIDGSDWRDVRSMSDLNWAITQGVMRGEPLHLTVTDAGGHGAHTVVLPLDALGSRELDGSTLRRIGLGDSYSEAVIAKVAPGGPAAKAGLAVGDHVLSVDGQTIEDRARLLELIRKSAAEGAPHTMTWRVERAGQTLELEVTPVAVGEGDKRIGRVEAYIGQPAATVLVRYGFVEGLVQGATRTWEMSVLTLKMLGKMLIGQASLKNLSGPLTIADYAGQSVKLGLAYYLGFLAIVSVSLGVLNLLPLPVLDGGHLMYYLFEAVTGRPVSEQWLARLQRGGLAFVLLMMSLALYNDVARLLGLH
jgi:regulator of sigma E protease